jgi:hypothetical protein
MSFRRWYHSRRSRRAEKKSRFHPGEAHLMRDVNRTYHYLSAMFQGLVTSNNDVLYMPITVTTDPCRI